MNRAASLTGIVCLIGVAATGVTSAVTPRAACAEDGKIAVAVVIDHAGLDGAPEVPVSVCVPVGPGATGADVLATRSKLLGTPPPRYDTSGLLCAIDGVPATGCANATPTGGFEYWGYFRGTVADGWTYAQEGPGTAIAAAGIVEGWRFTTGSGTPTDPKPAAAPDPDQICAGGPVSESGPEAEPAGSEGANTVGGSNSSVVGVVLIAALGAVGLVVARRRGHARSHG